MCMTQWAMREKFERPAVPAHAGGRLAAPFLVLRAGRARVSACLLSHHFSLPPSGEVLAASHTNLSTCGNSAKSVSA